MLIFHSWHKKGLRAKLFAAAIVAALLIGTATLLFSNRRGQQAEQPPENLQVHPLYATYDFSRGKKEIRFGIQPIWIFGGNVGEVMARDRILRRELQRLGLTIQFYPFLKGADINFFVHQGLLDGGMVGDMPFLTLAADADIAAVSLVDRGYDQIVSNRVMLVSDLKGKQVAYPSGSSSHHALLEALALEGLSEGDIIPVPMDISAMPSALGRGDVDAFVAWEPVVSAVLEQDPESRVIHRSAWTSFTFVTQALVTERRQAVRYLLAAHIRAARWIARGRNNAFESSQWAALSTEHMTKGEFVIDPERFTSLMYQDDMIRLAPIIGKYDIENDGPLAREFQFLKKLGRVPADADWGRVRRSFDRELIAGVLQAPDRYRLNEFQYDMSDRTAGAPRTAGRGGS